MAIYETVFIASPSSGADGSGEVLATIIDKAKGIVEAGKGIILSVDNWGARSLEYKIKKQEKGIYVCMVYKGDHRLISEVEKFLKLTEGVLRFMTVRVASTDEEWVKAVSSREKRRNKASVQASDETGETLGGAPGGPEPSHRDEHGRAPLHESSAKAGEEKHE